MPLWSPFPATLEGQILRSGNGSPREWGAPRVASPKMVKEGPPRHFAETTPQLPTGDYSYTLEIVMQMQRSMGKLEEAVGALKDQLKAHDTKLDGVGKEVQGIAKEVHGANVAIRVAIAIMTAVFAVAGFALKAYLDYSIAALQHKP